MRGNILKPATLRGTACLLLHLGLCPVNGFWQRAVSLVLNGINARGIGELSDGVSARCIDELTLLRGLHAKRGIEPSDQQSSKI